MLVISAVLKLLERSSRYRLCPGISHIFRHHSQRIMNGDFQNIYISCPDKPVYLRRWNHQDKDENETESKIENVAISKVFSNAGGRFIVFPITPISQAEPQLTYLSSVIGINNLHRQLSSLNPRIATFCIRLNESKHPEICKKTATRGLCFSCSNVDEQLEKLKKELLSFKNGEERFQIYQVFETSNNYLYIFREMRNFLEEDGENVYMQVIHRNSFPMLQDKSGGECPIFCMPELTPVFHSYAAARIVLEKIADIAEVEKLLETVDLYVSDMESMRSSDQPLKYPFVVVEGMDACGKTTLTEDLEQRMGAARFFTPPKPISHLRSFFDGFPEIVRRAYYSLGNYLVAVDIAKKLQSSPVIMDRFWHSTAAYGIANETSSGDMPESGHPVYNWPGDLLKPTLVLFLQVSEEERQKRLHGRGLQSTFEELNLEQDQLFRQRLCDAYRRMKDPHCVEIDASGSVMEVRNAVLNTMAKYGIHI